jgi:hypothetical protein
MATRISVEMSNGPNHLILNCLDAEQIKRIDKALSEIGDFGEVRLVKAKGKLRFIQKVSSEEIAGSRHNPVS